MVDRRGVPLARGLTAASRPDRPVFAPLVETIDAVERPRWRPRRPTGQTADKRCDRARCRAYLRRHVRADRIARKGVENRPKPGRHRQVAGRTPAWLARYRRLAIRHERRENIHQALPDLACAHI